MKIMKEFHSGKFKKRLYILQDMQTLIKRWQLLPHTPVVLGENRNNLYMLLTSEETTFKW